MKAVPLILITVVVWTLCFACGLFTPTDADRAQAVRFAIAGAVRACAERAKVSHEAEPELDELCARLLAP